MNHQDISTALLEIENEIRIDKCVLGRTSLWPIFRNYVSGALIRINRSSTKSTKKKIAFRNYIFAFLISLTNVIFKRSGRAKTVLMVTDQIYTVQLANQDFDRVLFGIADEAGLDSETIVIVDNAHMNFVDLNATSYNWIESFIFTSRCLAMVLAVIMLKLSRASTFISKKFRLNTLLDFNQNINKLLKKIDPRIQDIELLRNTLSVYYHSLFINYFFKNSSFTDVYHTNSFDPISSAINLAASRNRVNTICCQHGNQAESNPYFCKWSLDFDSNNSVFCKTYLCWDESSAKSIRNWRLNGSPPNIIISSNKWLPYAKKLAIQSLKPSENLQSSLCYFNVVVTLQPSFNISEHFFDALLEYSPKVKLWIRFHPAMTEVNEHCISRWVKMHERAEIENELTLPELLSFADLHVTASSSSIFEAVNAEIYTLFVSENACSYFAHFIADGHAEYIANPTGITDYLARMNV
tara:strand:- start:5543 stop:6943 length:1401 start_codon:yes stop_codon:yes gene_type:complete